MLRGLLRCAVLVILAAMLTGQVTELFDHWDHTLRTGREADYTLVVVAACAGLEFVLAKALLSFLGALPTFFSLPALPPSPGRVVFEPASSLAGPSPPLPVALRI